MDRYSRKPHGPGAEANGSLGAASASRLAQDANFGESLVRHRIEAVSALHDLDQRQEIALLRKDFIVPARSFVRRLEEEASRIGVTTGQTVAARLADPRWRQLLINGARDPRQEFVTLATANFDLSRFLLDWRKLMLRPRRVEIDRADPWRSLSETFRSPRAQWGGEGYLMKDLVGLPQPREKSRGVRESIEEYEARVQEHILGMRGKKHDYEDFTEALARDSRLAEVTRPWNLLSSPSLRLREFRGVYFGEPKRCGYEYSPGQGCVWTERYDWERRVPGFGYDSHSFWSYRGFPEDREFHAKVARVHFGFGLKEEVDCEFPLALFVLVSGLKALDEVGVIAEAQGLRVSGRLASNSSGTEWKPRDWKGRWSVRDFESLRLELGIELSR